MAVRSKLFKLDPTRLGLLRRQFMAEMRKRFVELERAIIDFILTQDELGLDPITSLTSSLATNARKYAFMTSDRKVAQFRKWLDEQVESKILKVDGQGRNWTGKYVSSAYRKGLIRGYTDANKKRLAGKEAGFQKGSQAQFLQGAFAKPERLSKVELLATRTFESMKGLTGQMKAQMNRVLSDAVVHGKGARATARELVKQVGIPRKRALVIARTELANAHAEGQLDSFEDLGISEVNAEVEFATAGDDDVCPECEDLEGTTFTVEEARGIIPVHPNCRCAWIPVLK